MTAFTVLYDIFLIHCLLSFLIAVNAYKTALYHVIGKTSIIESEKHLRSYGAFLVKFCLACRIFQANLSCLLNKPTNSNCGVIFNYLEKCLFRFCRFPECSTIQGQKALTECREVFRRLHEIKKSIKQKNN
ncbi:CLUMA_CG013440, isoform A [Clunio marinus]|uniref:CLUMA_CG013440, isoform A n=1 Tax=Clunio marinus TaxID=568069 RepID=A0A1J1IKT9_9DIPT|nr:CLUMA_CG013440, isoform A [Clunio marinus]